MQHNELTWILMRPKRQAAPWITYFEQNRMDYQYLPILEIEPLCEVESKLLLNQLHQADYIIITSANCIYCAPLPLLEALRVAQHKIVTMGKGTTDALGAQHIYPFYTAQDGMTSEWLLQDPLFEQQNVSGKSILLLGGVGGRTYLRHHLSQRQAAVTKVVLYQRTRVEWPLTEKYQYFDALISKTPIFVLTSQETLDALMAFTPVPYQRWLKEQYFVAISHRIYHYASTQGFKKIGNVNSMQIRKIHHFVEQGVLA